MQTIDQFSSQPSKSADTSIPKEDDYEETGIAPPPPPPVKPEPPFPPPYDKPKSKSS